MASFDLHVLHIKFVGLGSRKVVCAWMWPTGEISELTLIQIWQSIAIIENELKVHEFHKANSESNISCDFYNVVKWILASSFNLLILMLRNFKISWLWRWFDLEFCKNFQIFTETSQWQFQFYADKYFALAPAALWSFLGCHDKSLYWKISTWWVVIGQSLGGKSSHLKRRYHYWSLSVILKN